jgi:hypothetical protein
MFQTLCTRMTAGAALVIGSAMLVACSATDRQSAPVSAAAAPDQAAAGMKAFMDPVTGQMRDPTNAERAAAEKQGNAKVPGNQPRTMREQKLRKRGTAVTLEGDLLTPLHACTGADGNVVVDHDCNQATQPKQDNEGASP